VGQFHGASKVKHFKIQELVPEPVFMARGEKAIQLFDSNALRLIDWMRERYGACVINNWHIGGQFSQSGLRTVEFYGSPEKYFASFSQHKYGRAFDMKFIHKTAQEIREDMKLQWPSSGLGFSVSMESDVTWVHVDTRISDKLISEFKP